LACSEAYPAAKIGKGLFSTTIYLNPILLEVAKQAECTALKAEMTSKAKDNALKKLEEACAQANKDASVMAEKAAKAETALAEALRDAEAERAGRIEATRLLTENIRRAESHRTTVMDAATLTDEMTTISQADSPPHAERATPAEAMQAARVKAREGHAANGESEFATARDCFEAAFTLSEPAGLEFAKERATYLVSAANMALKLGALEDAKRQYELVLSMPRVDESIRKRVTEKLSDPRFAPTASLPERSCIAAKICMGEGCACRRHERAPEPPSVAETRAEQPRTSPELARLVRQVDAEARALAEAISVQAVVAPAAPKSKDPPPGLSYSSSGFAMEVYQEPSFLGAMLSGRESPTTVTAETSFDVLDVQVALKGTLALLQQSKQKLRQVEGSSLLPGEMASPATLVSGEL